MNGSKIFFRLSVCVLIAAMLLGGRQTAASATPPVPKNIIVMIGDGMGRGALDAAMADQGHQGDDTQCHRSLSSGGFCPGRPSTCPPRSCPVLI